MNENWLQKYYINELAEASSAFLEHTKLAKEVHDDNMTHQLQQARQYDIDRMFILCKLIKELK